MARTIVGLDSLERKLKRLPKAMSDEIRGAMEAVADDIVRMMKSLVPVDSGDLQKSIGWTWGDAPRGSLTISRVVSGSRKPLTITIYAGDERAYHARWVEFGTAPHVNRGIFSGTQNPGTSAQPFFFVSYRANKRPGKAKIRKAINTSAKKVAAT